MSGYDDIPIGMHDDPDPLDFPDGSLDPNDAIQGSQHSGNGDVDPTRICTILRPRGRASYSVGMCSVHVDEQTIADNLAEGPANQRTLLKVSWKTSNGGSLQDALVDATRGTMFTVGASQDVTIDAMVVRSYPAGPVWPAPGQRIFRKRISVVAHWGGSISAKAALLTSESIDLLGGQMSDLIPIPRQAQGFSAKSPTPALLPGLTAFFWSDDGPGRVVLYATDDPNHDGTPIDHGAEFVSFFSLQAMRVVPEWELWL